MATLNLSNVQPDFEGIRTQLQTALGNKASWKGLLPTQTGQTLIDFIAAVGAHSQAKAMRYGQDAYSETAIADRAIYAIADMQGLRLSRKLSAAIEVSMTYVKPTVGSPASVTLQAFTQFQGAGTYWYNNVPVVINDGQTLVITLYQGYVVDQTVAGVGSDYATFISVEKNFTVSDQDVRVWINNVPVTLTRQGLWLFKNQQAVLDRTTPGGELKLQFGNTLYGANPSPTDEVRILYAVTSGADGNSIQTAGQRISQTNNLVSGLSYESTAVSTGGANEPSAAVYKRISSSNFGAFGSAVTRSQYVSLALEYPGVVDAKMFAQRELDPTDYRLMNTIKVVLLTASPWSLAQQNAFLDTLEAGTMYSTRFYLASATAVPRTVSVHLYCYNWATLADCESAANAAITALFTPKQGILGYDVMLSDVVDAVLKSNSGIESLDIRTPTSDMQVSGRPMQEPTLTGVGGGSLPTGSYSYAVYADDGNGNTAVVNFSTIVLTTPGSVQIDWIPYSNASTYYVVGRLGGALGVIFSTPASSGILTYTDTGAATPTGTLPTAAQYPILYNSLGSLAVSSEYSARRV